MPARPGGATGDMAGPRDPHRVDGVNSRTEARDPEHVSSFF